MQFKTFIDLSVGRKKNVPQRVLYKKHCSVIEKNDVTLTISDKNE